MNNNENIVVFKVTSEFFEENGYIVHLEGKSKAIIFDPGSDVDQFLEYLSVKNLRVDAICLEKVPGKDMAHRFQLKFDRSGIWLQHP